MSVVNDVDLEGPPTTMEYINAYKVSDDTLESVANRDRDVVTEKNLFICLQVFCKLILTFSFKYPIIVFHNS